jgi:hypothetical protein
MVKKVWADSEDEEMLSITKIHSPFVEHLLVKMELIIRV